MRLDPEEDLGFYLLVSDLFAATENSFKAKLRSAVERLAASNILIGTSSWKYSGWLGTLYDQQRYFYRGKFAESRFDRDCLAEYAETFKTVCVDAACCSLSWQHNSKKVTYSFSRSGQCSPIRSGSLAPCAMVAS